MADQDHSPLEVVIVGAGVAGLASAIALRRAGHNITVSSFILFYVFQGINMLVRKTFIAIRAILTARLGRS